MKNSERTRKSAPRKGKGPKGRHLIDGVYRRYPCVAKKTAMAVLSAIDSPLSLSLLSELNSGNQRALVEAKINPLDYASAGSFRGDYLAVEFMSKFPNWDLGIDREAVAIEKFLSSERQCSASNVRLARAFGTPSTGVSTASYMYTAQRKIARLLPPFSWDDAEQYFGFGPGASYCLPRRSGDTYHKLGVVPEVTRECADLAYLAIARCPMWLSHVAGLSGKTPGPDMFNIVPGNRVTTVPKNAKTDRVIAIEPLMNMYIQKGIGGVIRRCLRRVGVDLNDQSLNQRLAKEGSLTDRLATIDLSAASDTISIEVVRQLLPPDWFDAVELARSKKGVLPDGTEIQYQKVSSMGNGFTFELESLIFWALCSSVMSFSTGVDRRLAVYGDDLIIPVDCYEPVERLLSHCGFVLNEKKSYASGPFRESCGKHYFHGDDVSPFYVRESVDSFDRNVLLQNNIRRWSARCGSPTTEEALQVVRGPLLDLLPPFWRKPRIPDGFGDIALIGDFDEVRPQKAPRGWEGWTTIGISEKSETSTADDLPYLMKALFALDRKKGGGSGFTGVLSDPSRSYVSPFIEEVRGASSVSMLPFKVVARKARWQVVKPVTPRWEKIGL